MNISMYIILTVNGFILSTLILLILKLYYKHRCVHKWIVVKDGSRTDENGYNIGHYYFYRCNNCSKMRRDRLFF